MLITVLAFASCRKTEFDSVVPSNAADKNVKSYHDGSNGDDGTDAGLGTTLFTDKDKCKKCHGGTTGGKMVQIDWRAPYMANGEYNSIEELIDNYDFVNNVHMNKAGVYTAKVQQAGITPEQKQALVDYLKTLARSSSEEK